MDQIYEKFTARELACRCGCGLGQDDMHPLFMEKLIKLRLETGISMPITSAARCSMHNRNVSTTGLHGPHTLTIWNDRFGSRCHAADINIWGSAFVELLKTVYTLKLKFTGIGINQRGKHSKRFLHLDDLPNAPGCPRPWVWTY